MKRLEPGVLYERAKAKAAAKAKAKKKSKELSKKEKVAIKGLV